MAERNHTMVTEFIFVGFTDHPDLQIPLFMLFLVMYVVSLMGNLGMIALIMVETRLHTPMYFFLSQMSIVDIGYSTAIAPRMLMTFVAETRTIPLIECAAQLFFICFFVTNECCLLAVIAYDRFKAICNPLLYRAIMSKRHCVLLVAGTYVCGSVNSVVQTLFIFSLSFCSSNVVNHFFCDVPPMLKLSCSDTHVTDLVLFTFSTVIVMTTFLGVLISYMCILLAILRIRSAKGRRKTFSTCASHLTVVTMFYGTLICIYLRPSSSYVMDQDKVTSVFYALVIPMLNPLIYSLRNKEVNDAFKRVIYKKIFSWSL
ncbi:olfactory receptor 1019-like [Malaclemys terrapin pileata]|uniref:olfactory receptor 1019-like n=1 Tax=Malaclemys terrapin pileata TaxID=2991368 RepID=UPI0023A8FAF3|nr:olfactory receptor 1019-like [Malaclemys terrapin pileata]